MGCTVTRQYTEAGHNIQITWKQISLKQCDIYAVVHSSPISAVCMNFLHSRRNVEILGTKMKLFEAKRNSKASNCQLWQWSSNAKAMQRTKPRMPRCNCKELQRTATSEWGLKTIHRSWLQTSSILIAQSGSSNMEIDDQPRKDARC